MLRRRIVALFTVLCVAWTALWPMVGSARALVQDGDMPLCHEAGTQVMPGMAPMSSPEGPAEPQVHCPLCIMAFIAAFAPPAVVAPAAFERSLEDPPLAAAGVPFDLSLQLPPSRAPPRLRR